MSSQGTRHPFLVRFERRKTQLYVQVIGDSTLENTVAYWRGILAEVQCKAPEAILLVDELIGESLTEAEWLNLVQRMKGQGLENVRIAHVKPHGLQQIEYCEIFARDAGFTAHVFDDEHAAELWLRYGED